MRASINSSMVCLAVVLAAPGSVAAQPGSFTDSGTWWVGYAANAPSQLMGVGTAMLTPRFGGWGLYVDAKSTLDQPSPFLMHLTPDDAADFGDWRFSQRSAWTNVNAAIVKVVGRELALYVGGGMGTRTTYVQFTDDTMERHDSGVYWVEDREQAGTFPNAMAGLFFRIGSRFVFQMGAESAPAGFTAGLHLVLR